MKAYILMLLILAPFTLADELDISSIEVEVDGDKDRYSGGDIKVNPGSRIEMTFTFKNKLNNDNNIEFIDVKLSVENIEDEGTSDMEIDKQIKKIKGGRDEEIIFKFDIPLSVEDDTYSLTIEADGSDENGTNHEVSNEYKLVVEKEDRELIYESIKLDKEEICDGTINLQVDIVNIGKNDENVEITAKSFLSSINKKANFKISKDTFDTANKISHTFNLEIPKGTPEKTYIIDVKSVYSYRFIEESLAFKVKCDETVQKPIPITIKTEKKKQKITPKVIDNKVTYEKNSMKGDLVIEKTGINLNLILLISLEILVVISILLIIRRKKRR